MVFNDRPRQGGYRDNFNSEPREMHKAICSECKKECEVPFKPTPGKDVFCKECFAKKPKAPRRY
jgi:CxxC-x17-CxxC domain-containing protein